jgi:hypothetical protein
VELLFLADFINFSTVDYLGLILSRGAATGRQGNRAGLVLRMPELPRELPLVQAARLDIWSTNDLYLDGERMRMSDRFVKRPWRYEQIDGARYRIPLDVGDQ